MATISHRLARSCIDGLDRLLNLATPSETARREPGLTPTGMYGSSGIISRCDPPILIATILPITDATKADLPGPGSPPSPASMRVGAGATHVDPALIQHELAVLVEMESRNLRPKSHHCPRPARTDRPIQICGVAGLSSCRCMMMPERKRVICGFAACWQGGKRIPSLHLACSWAPRPFTAVVAVPHMNRSMAWQRVDLGAADQHRDGFPRTDRLWGRPSHVWRGPACHQTPVITGSPGAPLSLIHFMPATRIGAVDVRFRADASSLPCYSARAQSVEVTP